MGGGTVTVLVTVAVTVGAGGVVALCVMPQQEQALA